MTNAALDCTRYLSLCDRLSQSSITGVAEKLLASAIAEPTQRSAECKRELEDGCAGDAAAMFT